MAALEAMSYQVPCLLSQACNLPEAFASKAAIEAEPDSAMLIESLERLFALHDLDRDAMGRRGVELVATKFNWRFVAGQFSSLYQWVLGRGDKPEFIV